MKKEVFFKKENSHYFFDEPEKIAKYCHTYCQEEVAHILRIADEVSRNYFIFDLKWDMERTYEPVIFEKEIDWGYMPKDDPEFIWQFNRHRYFICLGQAYQLTGKECYAETFVHLITDWISKCKRTPETQNTYWRVLEAGIRGENWTKALRYFKDSEALTEEALDAIHQSLIEHAEFILSMHSPYRYISNWGVIENHGLFEIAISLPESELTKKYSEIALKNLAVLARMGILNDGVQWEQSPMYHNEVLHCYLDVILLANRNQVPVPKEILDRVHRMAMADVAWKKPNHHQEIMGDSDDTDIRDLLSVAAYVFQDPVLKYAGFDSLDFESIWDLGYEALLEYEKMEKKEPSFTSIALEDSGNYYMRSDWTEKANLLHFHCGTIGAGHGHSDLLHLDLTVHGEDVLVDAGRYTYVFGKERCEFKDPMAHNTLTVDGKLFTICKDSWECSKLSQPVKQSFVSKDCYEFVQGGHLGYMTERSGVFVNRKIIHIKPDIYVLVDECYTGGSHTYQQYFHFNENGSVEIGESSLTYQGEQAEADFYFLSKNSTLCKKNSRISRNYNQAQENTCVEVSTEKEGFTSFLTVIHAGQKGKEKAEVSSLPVYSALKQTAYPSSMAEAVKITVGERSYVVIVCHQEVNSPTDLVLADDCYGFGNVIVFNKKEDTLVGEVLCY